MTDKLSGKELTAALRSLAAAHARAAKLWSKIAAHCIAVYGVDPAEVDCDAFLDGCDGLCGEPTGMTATEFDEAMREACEMKGFPSPKKHL